MNTARGRNIEGRAIDETRLGTWIVVEAGWSVRTASHFSTLLYVQKFI